MVRIGSSEGSVDGLDVKLALTEGFLFGVDLIHHRLKVALLDPCKKKKKKKKKKKRCQIAIHFYYWADSTLKELIEL